MPNEGNNFNSRSFDTEVIRIELERIASQHERFVDDFVDDLAISNIVSIAVRAVAFGGLLYVLCVLILSL
jgi:hypothetical protein